MNQSASNHVNDDNATDAQTRRNGLWFALVCYGIWGVLPLYFNLLAFASPLEIVAHRALWSLLLCGLILGLTRRLPQVAEVFRHPRQLAGLALAAGLIAVNWLVYVYAANNGQIVQASLGYFINPLLTVLLGVLVLRERLRRAQWAAMALAAVAVLIIGVGYGHPPWLALAMALSFGLYSLAKSVAGRRTAAVASLTVETLLLSPLALATIIWLTYRGEGHFTSHGVSGTWLLLSTGIITTVPLACFAAAARRLPLSVIGMLQYMAPTLQLVCAVLVNHEPMPTSRWIGFSIIWLALAIISADAWRGQRKRRVLPSSCEPLEQAG